MGAWGHDPESCDTYLDMIAEIFSPIRVVARADITKRVVGEDGEYPEDPDQNFKDAEDYIVSAAALLVKLGKAGLYYHNNEGDAEALLHKLDKMFLKDPAFKDWRSPEERRMEVEKLKNELEELIKKGSRGTTLLDKCYEHMAMDEIAGEVADGVDFAPMEDAV
jgi:hypothetical protein